MNRGIARRTLFESADDIRFFLSQIAHQVRQGRIEFHSFCVMSTHFHALVRSLIGELSSAMRDAQNAYVRRFNRRRRRDGPLVRGRYRSRPVRSLRYRRILVAYIDDNPVSAGLVRSAALYPHGSARYYASSRGPPWLERSWIDGFLQEQGAKESGPSSYSSTFGGTLLTAGMRRLIERRIAAGPHAIDPLDELFEAAAPATKDWMRRKAQLADGTKPGIPLVDPESVEHVLKGFRALDRSWTIELLHKSMDGWTLAKAALLRELCGATFEEIAQRSNCSTAVAYRLLRHHRRLVLSDEDYAERLTALMEAALSACHES